MVSDTRLAIVGSGLAGALLAAKLSSDAEVTVFERGSVSPARPLRPVETGRPLGLFPSFAYGLGGTTNYWHGGLLRMSPGEFGQAWPAGMDQVLQVRAKEVVSWLYGENSAQWWSALTSNAESQELFVDTIIKPSTPFRAARTRYFDRTKLKLNHEVISVRESSGKVIVQCREGNQIADYAFDVVVLAAGGLNSPLILKRSGLGGQNVCNNLTDHPMGFVAKITKRREVGNRFADLMGKTDGLHPYQSMLKVQDGETGLWTSFYLRPTSTASMYSDPYADSFPILSLTSAGKKYLKALSRFVNADFRAQAFAQVLGRPISGDHAYVLAVAEQEARGQGSIADAEDGGIRIHWEISDQVVRSIERSLVCLADWAGGTISAPAGDLRTRLWSAAHHSGGCRIAGDIEAGVVDTDLRVRGTNAIYVCDGSVLPSTGSSNTGLVIGCLALRLADQLSRARPVSAARVAAMQTRRVLLSGRTSHVGAMLAPAMDRAGISHTDLSLRYDNTLPSLLGGETILVHLANDSSSLEANHALQLKTAALLRQADIHKVIIPMSFATLQSSEARSGDPQTMNFGFEVRFADPYINGKLAAERFWTSWQAEDPSRRWVAFVYVPVILGPHSAWSRNIAGYRPGTRMWVPSLPRFFSITEERLAQKLIELCQRVSPPSVNRILLYDQSRSLADAIRRDRGPAEVRELHCPGLIWRALAFSRDVRAKALMAKTLGATNKILAGTLRQTIVPVDPLYYALFEAQSRSATAIEAAAEWD